MKTSFIIFAVILTVLAILLICGLVFFFVSAVSSGEKAKAETNTYTISEKFDKINIQSLEADIIFKQSDNEECDVVCVEPEKVHHNAVIENGTLKITVEDKRQWYERFGSFVSQSITVYLPSDHYDSLEIDNKTGNISVPSLFSFESASIHSTTGSITFNSSVNNLLGIETTTGGIRIDGTKAGEMKLSVTTGSADIENVNCDGDLSINVSTGRTLLTNVSCASVSSEGATGSITLNDTVATDYFAISRSTGSVHFQNSDATRITVKTSTGSVSGTLRSEKIFKASSSTGKITVPETSKGGLCEITTTTGSVKIEISE